MRMKICKNRMKILAAVLVLALAWTLLLVPVMADTDEEEGQPDVTISVVEDIPVQDIEEAEIPLAANPDTAARSGVRRVMLAAVFLLLTAAYVLYFSAYDRKLYALSREAAQEERSFMDMRTGREVRK